MCSLCKKFQVAKKWLLCSGCSKGVHRIKQREMRVKAFLDDDERFCHYTYHDVIMPCAPNKKRPDFVWIAADRAVILEVDEHEHGRYNAVCERAREQELRDQFAGNDLSMVLVRFNPDAKYIQEGLLYERLREELTRVLEIPVETLVGDSDMVRVLVGYGGQRKRALDAEWASEQEREWKRLQFSD